MNTESKPDTILDTGRRDRRGQSKRCRFTREARRRMAIALCLLLVPVCLALARAFVYLPFSADDPVYAEHIKRFEDEMRYYEHSGWYEKHPDAVRSTPPVSRSLDAIKAHRMIFSAANAANNEESEFYFVYRDTVNDCWLVVATPTSVIFWDIVSCGGVIGGDKCAIICSDGTILAVWHEM